MSDNVAMDNVTSMAAWRWDQISDPAAHSPRDVLVETLRQLDAGEITAQHVIVVLGTMEGMAAEWHLLRAGTFTAFAQAGLLAKAAHGIGRS